MHLRMTASNVGDYTLHHTHCCRYTQPLLYFCLEKHGLSISTVIFVPPIFAGFFNKLSAHISVKRKFDIFKQLAFTQLLFIILFNCISNTHSSHSNAIPSRVHLRKTEFDFTDFTLLSI